MSEEVTGDAKSADIVRLFEAGAEDALGAYLTLLHPVDIAHLFAYVSPDLWTRITTSLSPEVLGEVLTHLDDDQRVRLGKILQTERLISVVDGLETDDAADVLAALPEDKSSAVLGALEDREDIETLLKFDGDSAGGIMQTELCRVPENHTVDDAIEAVRRIRQDIDDVLEVYTVDGDGRLVGLVSLEDLVLSGKDRPLVEIATAATHRVTPHIDQEEVAQVFQKYDLVTLPVVDDQGVLLGRITFDDVQDVMEEEASEDIMAMAGVSSVEELVYSGHYLRIAVFRLPWLVSSLLGTMLTAYLMSFFARVPGDALLLASFVPVVMAMSGNFGSQSAMIVTRGLAIGKVGLQEAGRVFARELSVGVIIGVVSGTLVGSLVHLWKGHSLLGVAVGSAMSASMLIASGVGVAAPMMFKRAGIDPAIAAGPLVTTSCDILGVLVYLLMAIAVLG